MLTGCGCLLDYRYFKETHEMIAIDLGKPKALDADLEAMQHISSTANLDQVGDTIMFFIIETAKETFLDFSEETMRVL